MGRIAITALLVLFLAACQATSADSCAGFKPIRPTAADVASISPRLVDQILSHNRVGANLCGWRR
jgi:hypothetical protein